MQIKLTIKQIIIALILSLAAGCGASSDTQKTPLGGKGDNTNQTVVPITVKYEGNDQVARKFEPVAVTDCLDSNAGPRGFVSYSENVAESRSRTLTIQYDTVVAARLGLPLDENEVAALSPTAISAAMNVELTKPASSKSVTFEDRASIAPGRRGQFFRQTIKIIKTAKIYAGQEGAQELVGQVVVTDWQFRADFQTANSCGELKSIMPVSWDEVCTLH